jgi:hypothetical protein
VLTIDRCRGGSFAPSSERADADADGPRRCRLRESFDLKSHGEIEGFARAS